MFPPRSSRNSNKNTFFQQQLDNKDIHLTQSSASSVSPATFPKLDLDEQLLYDVIHAPIQPPRHSPEYWNPTTKAYVPGQLRETIEKEYNHPLGGLNTFYDFYVDWDHHLKRYGGPDGRGLWAYFSW